MRGTDSRYRLGSGGPSPSRWQALSSRELPELARPFLEDLVERCGETALIGTLATDAPVGVDIDKVDSQSLLRYTVSLGERRPLYCTAVGKLFLAYMTPEAQDEEPRTTRGSSRWPGIPSPTAPRSSAISPRSGARGSPVLREEVVEGAGGISAPIFDREGHLYCGARGGRAQPADERELRAIGQQVGRTPHGRSPGCWARPIGRSRRVEMPAGAPRGGFGIVLLPEVWSESRPHLPRGGGCRLRLLGVADSQSVFREAYAASPSPRWPPAACASVPRSPIR